MGLLSLRTLRGLTWLEVKAGVAIGVAIALGYGLQTWGLQSISSSKSAFITAMYVPLVPLLQWLCLGRMPGVMSCVGIVLAFIGLILLAGPENNLLALGVGGDDYSGERAGDRGGDYPYQRLGRESRCPTGDGRATGDRVAGGFRRHEAGG
ncbi:putative transmembrane protein [Klebsiella variicola]|uniref:Putative transmembrane protein n=1 Tax=Klebsiella variicola TaxID=244366 RepID=A0A7H4MH46_KLEVA|nr:putative transmembrane protein [Klebsiella variicola]